MYSDIQFNPSAIRASDCISEGIQLIRPKYWLFLGISLLGMIIGSCVPCLSVFFAGPIAVGIFFTLFTEMRGQPVDFGMMFKGFEKFIPAMLLGIIQSIPEIIGSGMRLAVQISEARPDLNPNSEAYLGNQLALQNFPDITFSGGIIAIVVVIMIAAMAFGFAWYTTFFFALPLITEYDLGITDAIKLSARAGWSNWSGIFVLSVFQFLVALVGMLLLCIGVFFVSPIIHASRAVAFRQVFPDHRQFFNNEPQPDFYSGTYETGQ